MYRLFHEFVFVWFECCTKTPDWFFSPFMLFCLSSKQIRSSAEHSCNIQIIPFSSPFTVELLFDLEEHISHKEVNMLLIRVIIDLLEKSQE